MPDITQLALFTAAAFLLAITPGPGIFYVAARTLAVSAAVRPISPWLDAQLFSLAAHFQGMSSSMRLFGQPSTRRVSRSVK